MLGVRERGIEPDSAATLFRDRRGAAGAHGCRSHSTCLQVASYAGSADSERELDRAFLRWFERRLVGSHGGTSDDVADYLIGLALTNL